MASPRIGVQRPAHEVRVAYAGDRRALAARTVRRIVGAVLAGEHVTPAAVTVTFVSVGRMRTLNRRSLGHDRATDVISYGMQHDGKLVADIYVCPTIARRSARQFGTNPREELIRIVVHGTLHALGYDHPNGADRTRSTMWGVQERYVSDVMKGPS